MASSTFRVAAFGAGLGALLLSGGLAQAAMPAFERPLTTKTPIVEVAQDGPRLHHGKRTQAAYCLRRNYWWFYRPYTTAQEDFPRCEPYFHYPDEANGPRGAKGKSYFK